MSRSLPRFLLAVATIVPSAAYADEAASPPSTATAAKKIQLSAGLFYGLPQGDFKEIQGMPPASFDGTEA